MKTGITLRPLRLDDLVACQALWQNTEGVVPRPWEDAAQLRRLLARNPELCWVATAHSGLVGTVLCGHDGWRGYLYHLAVAPGHRRLGIGAALVARARRQLSAQGIQRVHVFVEAHNAEAQAFWRTQGWGRREDIVVFSSDLNTDKVPLRNHHADTLPAPPDRP